MIPHTKKEKEFSLTIFFNSIFSVLFIFILNHIPQQNQLIEKVILIHVCMYLFILMMGILKIAFSIIIVCTSI